MEADSVIVAEGWAHDGPRTIASSMTSIADTLTQNTATKARAVGWTLKINAAVRASSSRITVALLVATKAVVRAIFRAQLGHSAEFATPSGKAVTCSMKTDAVAVALLGTVLHSRTVDATVSRITQTLAVPTLAVATTHVWAVG